MAATRLMHELEDIDSTEDLMHVLTSTPLATLCEAAALKRDEAHGCVVTFSPKVFLPLTRLCRDSCAYCTFAAPPRPGARCYMTPEEVVGLARAGAAVGCTEALFTLGDRPEARYPEAVCELAELGHASTLSYVTAAAGEVLRATPLLPHVNAGVVAGPALSALRAVSASQGLMLEGTAPALAAPGGPHHDCPDKDPTARLRCIEEAGERGVPFTTGLLLGIGEGRADTVDALRALRALHRRHGHVQELILQPFVPKPGTGMARTPPPDRAYTLWAVAAARLMFEPGMSVQSPPNLAAGGEGEWEALLRAGVNDWGGVSPLTRDWVNPEKAWPHLASLARATAAEGKLLLPRLPVYPSHSTLDQRGRWLDGRRGAGSPLAAVLRASDASGLSRGSSWWPGRDAKDREESMEGVEAGRTDVDDAAPSVQHSNRATHAHVPSPTTRSAAWRVSLCRDGALEAMPRPERASNALTELAVALASGQYAPAEAEVRLLLGARGTDFEAVCAAADNVRRRLHGDEVTYVVNRNINYTNLCAYACGFCAFSKGPSDARGSPYLLTKAEVGRRVAEAWARGASEVCMQGGIHHDFDGNTYLGLLEAAKSAAPNIHVHAFSPLEVWHGASTLGMSLPRYLSALKSAGLGSLPGTAAEVLDAPVRAAICPDKLSTEEWLEVAAAAHDAGLPTTSTIMFGSVEGPESWARHLLRLRSLAARSRLVTEFVPLPFVHMEAPLYRRGQARRGPTLHECTLLHAVSRLVFADGCIPSIQASWVKMGPSEAAGLLRAGCNDMGGVLMNESISRAAGASHGQELGPQAMDDLIRTAGRVPRQRTTLYGVPPRSQVEKAYAATPLMAV